MFLGFSWAACGLKKFAADHSQGFEMFPVFHTGVHASAVVVNGVDRPSLADKDATVLVYCSVLYYIVRLYDIEIKICQMTESERNLKETDSRPDDDYLISS